MQSEAGIHQTVSEILENFVENLPFVGSQQPIKTSDFDKSHTKHSGLLNYYFCRNKNQIFPKRREKLPLFTFFHYRKQKLQ